MFDEKGIIVKPVQIQVVQLKYTQYTPIYASISYKYICYDVH